MYSTATAAPGRLQQLHYILRRAARVELFDESHGVFCQLLPPSVVLEALRYEDNVGQIDDPAVASAVTALHSLYYQAAVGTETTTATADTIVEFENATSFPVHVRWMDERGHNNSATSEWNMQPFSTMIQLARPGYLYLLTVVLHVNKEPATAATTTTSEEYVLGAYRTLKPLASGMPHCILIEEEEARVEDESSPVPPSNTVFHLESLLTDDTHTDTLQVAAAGLDPILAASASSSGTHYANLRKTIGALATVVQNILEHPTDAKYQKLKLSNTKVQHLLVPCPAALYMLHLLGFREEPVDHDCLILWKQAPDISLFRRAANCFKQLRQRSQPDFVAELAESVPWQPPIWMTAANGGALATHWHTEGTHFVTPDERWARTERWAANRQSGRARRPNPGEAPSSRGNWGR